MATEFPNASARSRRRSCRSNKGRYTRHSIASKKRGWLLAEWGESGNGRQAKFYKLSAKGRKQLVEEESNWNRLSGAVSLIMDSAQ